jgi:excisionase family DNA binding protein
MPEETMKPRPLNSASKTAQISAETVEKATLRVEEAAALLSVSRWTIYRWVEAGRLQGTHLGKGSLRIFRESAVSLIEHNHIGLSTASPGTEDS